jgi:hypothetical protein
MLTGAAFSGTPLQHYVLMDEQQVTDDVFGQMSGGKASDVKS